MILVTYHYIWWLKTRDADMIWRAYGGLNGLKLLKVNSSCPTLLLALKSNCLPMYALLSCFCTVKCFVSWFWKFESCWVPCIFWNSVSLSRVSLTKTVQYTCFLHVYIYTHICSRKLHQARLANCTGMICKYMISHTQIYVHIYVTFKWVHMTVYITVCTWLMRMKSILIFIRHGSRVHRGAWYKDSQLNTEAQSKKKTRSTRKKVWRILIIYSSRGYNTAVSDCMS